MANRAGRDVFLLLPWVLLEGGASRASLGAEGLGLLVVERLLERVWKGGGELTRTMFPIGGRPPPIGNNVKTSLRRIIPSLIRFGLSSPRHRALLCRHRKVHHLHPLLLTRRYPPAYKYHLFSFSYHSNMADLHCFQAYATANLVGSNNHRLAEIMSWRSLGEIRENPRPPNNSCPKEVITACQYPCIAVV